MRHYISSLFALCSLFLLAGCITTARSTHTTAEARQFVKENMLLTDVQQWAGVRSTVLSVHRDDAIMPVGYVHQFLLSDGVLFVTERPQKDGATRVGAIKIESR
jgi:hypothetical protein